MGFSPVRSISGRIVLGFAILMVTVFALSGMTIYKMSDLGRELRFIRTAYLEVSLRFAQLLSEQGAIVQVLGSGQGLVEASSARLNYHLDERRKLLSESGDLLQQLGEVPDRRRS